MKRILCYGDSNTWGFISGTGERFDENTRYSKLLGKFLGEGFEVVEDGLNGRNLGHDITILGRGNLNGARTFASSVMGADPLDYVIIMLGTNDIGKQFDCDTKGCAEILKTSYIDEINKNLKGFLKVIPRIIIVAPCEIGEAASGDKGESAVQKSKTFNRDYRKVAEENGCLFVDNNGLETGIDGLHLTKKSHELLAKKLCDLIKADLKTKNIFPKPF